MSKPTRIQRVLWRLQVAGEQGVFSFDLKSAGGWRYAARINDLKKLGYDILSKSEKRGDERGCRYFLKEASYA